MEDILLEDEPVFEPFDSYEDYEDEMMLEAERQDQLMANAVKSAGASTGGVHATTLSSADTLPQQQDYLAMFKSQNQAGEQELQKVQQQQQQQRQQQQQVQQQQQQQQRRPKGGKASRPIGSTAVGPEDDLAAVKVTKKRAKLVTLDTER